MNAKLRSGQSQQLGVIQEMVPVPVSIDKISDRRPPLECLRNHQRGNALWSINYRCLSALPVGNQITVGRDRACFKGLNNHSAPPQRMPSMTARPSLFLLVVLVLDRKS